MSETHPPRRRDRRGRGRRGPDILPPQVPGGRCAPSRRSRRERFDRAVLWVVADIEQRWHQRLGLVEYAVEEAPMIPDHWHDAQVPLSSLVRGSGGRPTRLVLFRRPIERRCSSLEELDALVLTVIVEQVAELLGIPSEEVDPRY